MTFCLENFILQKKGLLDWALWQFCPAVLIVSTCQGSCFTGRGSFFYIRSIRVFIVITVMKNIIKQEEETVYKDGDNEDDDGDDDDERD